MLAKYIECNPDKCPMADECPDGPMPQAPCRLKEQFSFHLDRTISDTFTKLDKAPETRLRLDILLKPLFEQLLILKMAELRNNYVFSGSKINPIFREMRQCILAINNILTESVKAYKEETEEKLPNNNALNTLQGKGYYELLCYDGVASLETRVGPN